MIVARLEELREPRACSPPKRPPPPPPAPAASNLEERRARLARRRARFLEAFADSHMTREELAAAMKKVDAERLKIDAAEHAPKRTRPLAEPGARRAALKRVGAIRRAWGKATREEKRKIVGLLAHAAKLAAGEPCAFTWRTAEELAEPEIG